MEIDKVLGLEIETIQKMKDYFAKKGYKPEAEDFQKELDRMA